jgi:signal transduction histidine kinase
MNKLLDKLVVFIFCFTLYIQNTNNAYIVVPVIIAIAFAALNSYFTSGRFHLISFTAYLGICFFSPLFLFFAPLICYDILLSKRQWFALFVLVTAAANYSKIPAVVYLLLMLMTGLAWLMKRRTGSAEKIKSEYTDLRDSTKEFSLRLEDKNKELMEKQDYEINLATLNERNRIAREIHDSVGHLLSSSILQIGALMATCEDDAVKGSLNTLKETLSGGMDSIRDNIHNLHEESVDLYVETNTLVKNFKFCPITLAYDVRSNPEKKFKYAFISILKEALSNIIKHSGATSVSVTLREHPALYQLVVKDNGTKTGMDTEGGLGLKNIADRVAGLNGSVNFSNSNGFTIFISIPKE